MSNFEESMGVRDNATNDEMITAKETTIPNSLNNLPVRPCKNITGRNTEAKATVVDTTAKYLF